MTLKISFLYQISSELRFTIFPNLWKNAAIFPNSTYTGTSLQKVKKIADNAKYSNFFQRTRQMLMQWNKYVWLLFLHCI